jgi:hypothetical protein
VRRRPRDETRARNAREHRDNAFSILRADSFAEEEEEEERTGGTAPETIADATILAPTSRSGTDIRSTRKHKAMESPVT